MGPTVEKTRRGVERMEVEEDLNKTKASVSAGRLKERLTSAAREGWSKVMNRLRGRELKREGGELVVEKRMQSVSDEVGKSLLSEEVRGEWMDESEAGTVEVEVVEEEKEADSMSVRSSDSKKIRAGFGFLDKMEDEERDEELDRVRSTGRKRKRGDGETEEKKGLIGTAGWEWREREGTGEKRWKRETTGWTVGEKGEKVSTKTWEKVPLPECFRLGLEERGKRMNHSGRPKNNFGVNKAPLFPGGKDGK
jgi:hypothetical protein